MPGYTKTPTSERSTLKNQVSLAPRTTSFGAEAGAEGHKPTPTTEGLEVASLAEEKEEETWLQSLFPDHNVSMEDLSDADREAIENLPEGGTLHLTFENQEMSGVGAADEQERLAAYEGVTSVHNASPGVIQYLMQSGKFENLIMNSHASEEGIIITGEDGKPQLLPAADLAAMAEGSTIQRAVLEGCNSGDGISEKFAEVGIQNVGYSNEVTNRQGLADAEVLASTGSLEGIETNHEVAAEMRETLEGSDQRFAHMYLDHSGGSELHEADPAAAASAAGPQVAKSPGAAGPGAAKATPARLRMGSFLGGMGRV